VDKKWIIVGPGRTGSLLIVRSLYVFYGFNYSKFTYLGPNVVPKPLEPNSIVHSHDPNWVNFADDNTRVIVSTRDPVESALSWCIQPMIGKWHIMNIRDLNQTCITKFVLDPNTLLRTYNKIINFYKNFVVLPEYTVLNYEMFWATT
jgi:hypothetical protein